MTTTQILAPDADGYALVRINQMGGILGVRPSIRRKRLPVRREDDTDRIGIIVRNAKSEALTPPSFDPATQPPATQPIGVNYSRGVSIQDRDANIGILRQNLIHQPDNRAISRGSRQVDSTKEDHTDTHGD